MVGPVCRSDGGCTRVATTYRWGPALQGIPLAAFDGDDLAAECKRLKALGVVFTQEPTMAGPVSIAVCADTSGNLIQLYQAATSDR